MRGVISANPVYNVFKFSTPLCMKVCERSSTERVVSATLPSSIFVLRYLDTVTIDSSRVGLVMPIYPGNVIDIAEAVKSKPEAEKVRSSNNLLMNSLLYILHSQWLVAYFFYTRSITVITI